MAAFPNHPKGRFSGSVRSWGGRASRRRLWFGLAAALLLGLGLIPARPAFAASIVVNSLADNATGGNGLCTLREAINNANSTAGDTTSSDCAAGSNSPTGDTITFSVSGTISTSSALPGIQDDASDDTGPVTIDGDNDDNGTPDITLSRSSGAGAALQVGRGGATTSSIVIRGLTITGYTSQGITLTRVTSTTIEDCIIHANSSHGILISNVNTSGVTIEDCRIGVNGSDTASANGGDGIRVTDGADNITIRNSIVSANSGDGIHIEGGGGNGSGHLIENNKIGTNVDGTSCATDFGNATVGILITGGVSGMTIQNNIISCNGRTQPAGGTNGDGIEMSTASTTNNLIKNNYIGTNSVGASMGNHQNGIDINGGTANTIQGNTIANNGTTATTANNDGVRIDGTTTDNHTITQNSIYNNGGADADGLGIDLDGDGVTANDSGDPDSGSNAKHNFPVITAAVGNGGTGMYDVTFSWDFKPGEGPWTIEFFCNKDGGDEGKSYQASTTIASGSASGSTTFSFTPVAGTCNDATNNRITATATNTTGSTSEFSATADPTAILLKRLQATPTTPSLMAAIVFLFLLGIGAGVLLRRRRSI